MPVSDLPGWLQGYVFDDTDANAYDSSGQYFIDQAGYSDQTVSRCTLLTGTPAFVDVNSARGLVMDNTCHWELAGPVGFNGSVIVVCGAVSWTPNGTERFAIYKGEGAATTRAASPRYEITHFSGNFQHKWNGADGNPTVTVTPGGRGIEVLAGSIDQQARQTKWLRSNGTVTSSSAKADDDRGIRMLGGTDSYTYRLQVLGNLSGVPGNTTAIGASNQLVICELHFFSGILTDTPTTAVETVLAELEAIYG
jgi:hypothetical protein